MIHGVTFPVTIGVLGLALWTGSLGQERPVYFPRALYEATLNCGLRGLVRPSHAMDEFRADWYGSHLRAAGEAPIFNSPTPTLRFTWLRTFDAPVVVRVDRTPDGAVLMTATELSGKGGYEPGVVARRVERRLSAGEVAALTRMLDEGRALAQAPGDCASGLDGARWILESAGPGGYRFVDRWTPQDGPVRELGLHLIGLTGWTWDRSY